jgi:tyrosyl-tRNA synthetase
MNFVEELRWRGMLHDIMPGTEELLKKETVTGYIGFDPTADSLHVGTLVQIMTLLHFQRAGHKPVALVGGATGMVGDPSGKSQERNLLDEETLRANQDGIRRQLERFLDFDCGETSATIVNNYDWTRDYTVLRFARDIGKHITVSYMLSKDSVQNRLETGMSFTEFMYQLFQGYDFYHLWKHHGVKLQMGGSDQWGNIVTGTELIRRKGGGEAFALTTNLIHKADGTKFGKTESGNVWLDAARTSPYKFYQFWLNASDADVAGYIRIFTLMEKDAIEALEREHAAAPHLRILQKALAKDITVRVHSAAGYEGAVEASGILFDKEATGKLRSLSEAMLLDIMDGVPQADVDKSVFSGGVNLTELLTEKTGIFPSKGEARKMIQAGGVSVNKHKVSDANQVVSADELLNGKYLLVQKGKKNYFLVRAS